MIIINEGKYLEVCEGNICEFKDESNSNKRLWWKQEITINNKIYNRLISKIDETYSLHYIDNKLCIKKYDETLKDEIFIEAVLTENERCTIS